MEIPIDRPTNAGRYDEIITGASRGEFNDEAVTLYLLKYDSVIRWRRPSEHLRP